MSLLLNKSGYLPIGTWPASWQQLIEVFGFNEHRQELLAGLERGLRVLYQYGCKEVCIGGSFVTNKKLPGDVDACYENSHMDWKGLKKAHPEFFDVANGNKRQKELYKSEFYPYNSYEDYWYDFFQNDRDGNRKGMVKIYLDQLFNNDKKREAI
jgi:hypothetical protein